MIEITDATKNGKRYNGNTPKLGVVFNGQDCIVCRHDFDKEIAKWQILK